jgi:hypothetical protein
VIVPTTPNGDTRTSPGPMRSVAVAAQVRRHILDSEDGGEMITIRHQPQGPVAYLFEPDDELVVEAIDIHGGNIVTQAYHQRWGRIIVVPNGPSVTEVCLHDDVDQRRVYRERAYALDDQYREAFAMIEINQDGEDSPDPDA